MRANVPPPIQRSAPTSARGDVYAIDLFRAVVSRVGAAAVARRCGVSLDTVADWIAGRRAPPYVVRRMLKNEYEVPIAVPWMARPPRSARMRRPRTDTPLRASATPSRETTTT